MREKSKRKESFSNQCFVPLEAQHPRKIFPELHTPVKVFLSIIPIRESSILSLSGKLPSAFTSTEPNLSGKTI